LRDFIAIARDLSLDVLLEVHEESELETALETDCRLIGVNNRDLRTFSVDLATTERLARLLPAGVILVAESGIVSGADVRRMGAAGARAVLVGEALVTAPDMAARVRELSSQPREG